MRNLFLAPKVNFFLIETRSELEKDETVYCLFVWPNDGSSLHQISLKVLTGSMESCLEQLIWIIV